MNKVMLDIREVLLALIKEQEPKDNTSAPLQQSSVLAAAAIRLKNYDGQAILTQWGDLFRTGLLAWGLNLSNPNQPFFHLTERGRTALENATRDPSNPAGYLKHLQSISTLDPIAMSYLTEGLDCYVAGLFKAGAVMVGASAERIVLDLRDHTIDKLASLSKPVPKNLNDWKIKTVTFSLQQFFDTQKSQFKIVLREEFESYWSAFALQIRATRNDAGHPTSIDPVTAERLHSSLLIFPELARLAQDLKTWVDTEMK